MGAWPFFRERVVGQQNECNLSCGRWRTEYCFVVFSSKKSISAEWKSKNCFLGGTFFLIPAVLLGILFPNTVGFIYGWNGTNRVNFMKIDSKLRPVSCILIHKYIKDISILTLRISNQGPSKRKMWPSPLTTLWSCNVRIVVISFRNITLKIFMTKILFSLPPFFWRTFLWNRYFIIYFFCIHFQRGSRS